MNGIITKYFTLCNIYDEVVTLKERPLTRIDYSARKCPVWSHDGTVSGEITDPKQLAIDDKTQNIFVTDHYANRIQVFDGEGNHLYQILTPPYPAGITLSDEYIFVSTRDKLVKIEKSNNQSIKSVETENKVCGIDTNTNSDIYGCEFSNQSIVVFDKDLKFLKRIKLRTTQVASNTYTKISNCMKIRCMSCLMTIFPLFLSLYRYSI